MSTENKIEFALCWFDQEEWEKLAQVDPDGVDNSYEEWKKGANKAISNGQKVRKISIKIADLVKWCEENGKSPNSSSRSEYVAMLAQRRNENKKT